MGTRRDGIVKIGRSVNPWTRLAAVQAGHPEPLAVLLALPGDHVEEQALHAYFADRRVSEREWFDFSNGDSVAEVAARWFAASSTPIPEPVAEIAPPRACTCDLQTPVDAPRAAGPGRSVYVLSGFEAGVPAVGELHKWQLAPDGCWVGTVRMAADGAWCAVTANNLMPGPGAALLAT